jgi:ABC-type nitrate/sulfonate/bicarbonate transport system substrate-binding protein
MGFFSHTYRLKLGLAALLLLGIATIVPAADDRATGMGDGTPALVFGSSTTALPNALLAEVIKRDRVLRKNLQGTSLSFSSFEKGPDIVRRIGENKIDVAILGDFPTLEAAIASDVFIVALLRQNFATTVGPKGKTLAGLKGQRIGIASGTSGVFTLLQGLESVGLVEQDVKFIPLPIDELTDALLSGKVDAVAMFEPLPSAIIKKYPDRFSALHKQASSAYLLLSKQLTDKHPKAALQITAATARAIRWLRKDRANLALASQWALGAMMSFGGKNALLTETEISKQVRSSLLDLSDAPALPQNSANKDSLLGQEFEFMKRHGKLPAKVDWEKVGNSFRPETMKSILADPKKYQLDVFDYAN